MATEPCENGRRLVLFRGAGRNRMPVYDLNIPADRLRLAVDQINRDRRQMVAHIIEWRYGKEAREEMIAAWRARK